MTKTCEFCGRECTCAEVDAMVEQASDLKCRTCGTRLLSVEADKGRKCARCSRFARAAVKKTKNGKIPAKAHPRRECPVDALYGCRGCNPTIEGPRLKAIALTD